MGWLTSRPVDESDRNRVIPGPWMCFSHHPLRTELTALVRMSVSCLSTSLIADIESFSSLWIMGRSPRLCSSGPNDSSSTWGDSPNGPSDSSHSSAGSRACFSSGTWQGEFRIRFDRPVAGRGDIRSKRASDSPCIRGQAVRLGLAGGHPLTGACRGVVAKTATDALDLGTRRGRATVSFALQSRGLRRGRHRPGARASGLETASRPNLLAFGTWESP